MSQCICNEQIQIAMSKILKNKTKRFAKNKHQIEAVIGKQFSKAFAKKLLRRKNKPRCLSHKHVGFVKRYRRAQINKQTQVDDQVVHVPKQPRNENEIELQCMMQSIINERNLIQEPTLINDDISSVF